MCLGIRGKKPGSDTQGQMNNAALIFSKDGNLDLSVSECVSGAFSYNGQRCTALKILFVHETIVEQFLQKFTAAVDALSMGMPWVPGVKITPLPEEHKPGYLRELVKD